MSVTTYTTGKYLAEILDQGFEESAAKRTPAFYLQLRILGRYGADGQLEDCPRYERTYRQYLANETGAGILKGDLRSLDVQFNDLSQLEPGTHNHVSLVGRRIDVACEIERHICWPVEASPLRARRRRAAGCEAVI